jgi:hypothetical protein
MRDLFLAFIATALVCNACSDDSDTAPVIMDAGFNTDSQLSLSDVEPDVALECEADAWISGGECIECVPRECANIVANLSVDTASNRLTLDTNGVGGPPISSATASGSVRVSGGLLSVAMADAEIEGALLVFDFSEHSGAEEIQVDFMTFVDSCGEEQLRPAVRWIPGGASEIPGFCR